MKEESSPGEYFWRYDLPDSDGTDRIILGSEGMRAANVSMHRDSQGLLIPESTFFTITGHEDKADFDAAYRYVSSAPGMLSKDRNILLEMKDDFTKVLPYRPGSIGHAIYKWFSSPEEADELFKKAREVLDAVRKKDFEDSLGM